MNFSRLINLLAENEISYVDELDRLIRSPAEVLLFPENLIESGGGWLYLSGEPESGDWNIARMIGSPSKAFDCLNLLPEKEINLLLPENVLIEKSSCLRQLSSLHFFMDDCCKDNAETEIEYSLKVIEKKLKSCGFSIRARYYATEKSFDEVGLLDGIFLLSEEAVKGYVKVVRRSPGCNEVYIEVEPALRNRGIGSEILKYAMLECRRKKKIIIYAVDEHNQASILTAKKAGLKHYQTLSRFCFPKS